LLLVAYAATAAAFTSVPGASTLAVAGRRPLFARRAAASVERRTVLTAKATTITEEEFEVMMEAKAKPILVDFYADWCGPCKLVEPFVNEMAELYPGIDVVKIDIDSARALVKQYSLKGLPYLAVFKDGEKKGGIEGAIGKQKVVDLLKKQCPEALK